MANDALWTPDPAGSPHGDALPVVATDLLDPFLQDLGYEAADPMLAARLLGEAPVNWPAYESRP
jgi:hypothetical protein